MVKTGRGSVQQMLRLPEGMRERLREAAETNNRSMNAEIIERLEYTFERLDAEMQSMLDENQNLSRLLADRTTEIARLEAVLDSDRRRAELVPDLENRIADLRLELAREQGKTASLENGMNIFMQRLIGSGDRSGLLDQIMADIKNSAPPKPKA